MILIGVLFGGIFLFIIIILIVVLFLFIGGNSINEGSGMDINEFLYANILQGSNKSISFTEMQSILLTQLGGEMVIITVDERYNVPKRSSIEKFLLFDNTDLLDYVAESTDCDDFARILQGEVLKQVAQFRTYNPNDTYGISFGTVYGDISLDGVSETIPHVMNLAIVEDGEGGYTILLIEPQTDEIYTPNDKSNYWAVVI